MVASCLGGDWHFCHRHHQSSREALLPGSGEESPLEGASCYGALDRMRRGLGAWAQIGSGSSSWLGGCARTMLLSRPAPWLALVSVPSSLCRSFMLRVAWLEGRAGARNASTLPKFPDLVSSRRSSSGCWHQAVCPGSCRPPEYDRDTSCQEALLHHHHAPLRSSAAPLSGSSSSL